MFTHIKHLHTGSTPQIGPEYQRVGKFLRRKYRIIYKTFFKMFLESILLLAITTLTSSQLIESRCSRPAFSKVIGKQTHLSCAERSFFKSAREISQMAHEMGTLTIRRDWLGVNHQVTGRAFGTERHKRSTPSFLGCST